MTPSERNGSGPTKPGRRPARSWWGGNADRGDSVRLEAFSDGVLAIAITLLILEVRVEQQPGQTLAAALGHAGPEDRRLRRQLPADRDHVGDDDRLVGDIGTGVVRRVLA